jgi:hypothetical protein
VSIERKTTGSSRIFGCACTVPRLKNSNSPGPNSALAGRSQLLPTVMDVPRDLHPILLSDTCCVLGSSTMGMQDGSLGHRFDLVHRADTSRDLLVAAFKDLPFIQLGPFDLFDGNCSGWADYSSNLSAAHHSLFTWLLECGCSPNNGRARYGRRQARITISLSRRHESEGIHYLLVPGDNEFYRLSNSIR